MRRAVLWDVEVQGSVSPYFQTYRICVVIWGLLTLMWFYRHFKYRGKKGLIPSNYSYWSPYSYQQISCPLPSYIYSTNMSWSLTCERHCCRYQDFTQRCRKQPRLYREQTNKYILGHRKDKKRILRNIPSTLVGLVRACLNLETECTPRPQCGMYKRPITWSFMVIGEEKYI